MAFVIYELEEIGNPEFSSNLEAVAVHWYCSQNCQTIGVEDFPVTQSLSVSSEQNNDFADGTICESCNRPL